MAACRAQHGPPPWDAPVWGPGTRALTALFETGVWMHFVDSFIPASQESSVKPETEQSVAQPLHLGYTNLQVAVQVSEERLLFS